MADSAPMKTDLASMKTKDGRFTYEAAGDPNLPPLVFLHGIGGAARLRPSTVTVAPARDNAAAISRPMPRPPPVTSACDERDNPDIRRLS